MKPKSLASLLSMILSNKLRRRRYTSLILGIAMTFMLYASLVQEEEGHEKLSVSDIFRFTNQEMRPSKGIIIHPKKTCEKACKNNIVITVVSKTSNTDRRQTIRQTWGHTEMQRKYNFCLFFVVGTEENVDISKEANSENGDIVQVNVSENYYRLTEKVIETFNWIINFCQEPRYFFKMDDDVYFDLEFLNEFYQDEYYLPDDILLGSCKQSTAVSRVRSKYHTSFEEYPFESFPPYCGGPGYMMTMNTARKIYHEMLVTKTFKLEDAYLGLAIYKLDIPVKNVDNFIYALDENDGYMQNFNIHCSRISHGLTYKNIQHLWEKRNRRENISGDCLFWGKLRYTLRYLSSFITDQGNDFRISE
ncbi:beta-1,3-galactosyltransferase 5-like [Pecten maximus]|uniref:beta-1,3-galactosyltransferase 5-like n=1 Tax=Pecten maximus TaxID=6579 RepID=UPI0014585647|nr:beta-1,3-galactosyltransferase 5-like [Pecten maximus]